MSGEPEKPAAPRDEAAPAAEAPPPGTSAGTTLPPDPAAYDSERNVHARARGLAAPYIAGGRDPDPEEGRREERFYGRLLLLMVVVIVLAGFVLGIIANLITGGG
jgi:hypothetical protein